MVSEVRLLVNPLPAQESLDDLWPMLPIPLPHIFFKVTNYMHGLNICPSSTLLPVQALRSSLLALLASD